MSAGVKEQAAGNLCLRKSNLLQVPSVAAEKRNPLLGNIDNIEIPVLIEFWLPDILEFPGTLSLSPDGQKVFPVRAILLDPLSIPIGDKDIPVFVHIEIDALPEHVIFVPLAYPDRQILPEYEGALFFVRRLRDFAAGDNWDLAGLRPNAFSRCRDYWSRPDEKNRDDHGSTIVESLKASHRGLPPLIN